MPGLEEATRAGGEKRGALLGKRLETDLVLEAAMQNRDEAMKSPRELERTKPASVTRG